MAGTKLWLQNVIISFIFVLTGVTSSKLNVPRVLLPIFNDFSTKFTLEATEGGCYKWSTTRADIIQITPLNEDKDLECSTKIIVSTITREAARNIAVVLAEDVHTKQNLRCDVIVDVIHSLTISTTTRELFMEEAPEDFEVKAYDDQGNEFSSLEDVEFDWTIVSLGPNKDTVLRYITFMDSPYETPPAIEDLENKQKKGYSILLEGIKSGSAKVSVRLPYPEYKHVETIEVQLMVVANLLLTPPEVYVMPGVVVPYKIFYLNNGRMEEIALPDSQYYIEAEDMEIASSIKKTGNVTALKVGKTRIVLRDRNVGKDDPLMKLPAATIHVVQPEYLVINVLPHKNWAIMVGDHHDIVAEVYSSTDHKLYLSGEVQMSLDISPEFHVSSRSENNSWATGYGVKSSVAAVQATLDGVYNEKTGQIKFDKPIVTRGDLLIYPRITIEPSEVILPWDPVTRPKYDIDLVAKGGDGRFLWISSDNSIGLVSQTGHVRTHSNGFFEVSAVMLRNHHNRQSTKFMIIPPSRLEIIEFVMEAEVGTPVYLHIALYAEQTGNDGKTMQIPFTKCQELPFQIKQSDVKFRHNKTSVLPPIGISCGNIAMVGLNVGTSKVTVTYYQDGQALEDSVTVSAYKPLALLQPKRQIVLAVGSSINLVYTGGPRPIIGRSGDHQRVIVSEDDTIAQAQDITQFHSIPGEDFTVVQVLCRKLGETDMKLMISNSPSTSNCKGQTASITTRVTCGKPRKITLQPDLKIADADACPMDLTSGNAVVQSTKTIDIDVTVYDDCGNKFLNISSFNLGWILNPIKTGVLLSKDGVFPNNMTLGTVPIAHKSFQSLMPSVEVGNLNVNVTVIGYKTAVLKANGITAEWPEFITDEDRGNEFQLITASLMLFLVDDTAISPSTITLFNHPGNKKTLPIKSGSGYFELALSEDNIANVKYLEASKELEISPVKSGEVTIQLLDLCLVSRPATLMVIVVSVGIIRVEMVDKVEIGKCISCIVRLYDENDNLMDIPDPRMIDLRPEFENKIANIQRAEEDPKNPWNMGEIHYIITGVEVGDSKLVFTAATNDEDVNSAPVDLQVFQPIKLYPRDGTILIGSTMQLTIKGGPQPDSNILFTVTYSKTAEVSDRGVITGTALGKTKIFAQSVGVHAYTGQSIIFSEDTVEIQVVKLEGIKIAAPLTRFRMGATVPFWCFGVPDISPMVLGSVDNPPIKFKWGVDDQLLADLTGVFQPIGVNIERTDKVVLKLTGLQAGSTRVFLNATVPGITVNLPHVDTVMLSAFIDIEVVEQFSLLTPKGVPGSPLLMAPFSRLQLETNLDGLSKVTYSLPGDQAPSTELLADKSVYHGGDVVTVSPTGVLTSYGILGHALLIITAMDEHGMKQQLTITVEVKPIHYMNLNIIANWRISSSNLVHTVPLGTEFQLKASYHDNIGNQFHSGPTELKVRTSRCDLLKIVPGHEDGSVFVYTKKAGHTMLKAWADGIQKTADYVKISVKQSVKPDLDHLTSGDTVCLWTPVVSENNVPGTWKSSDSSLLDIDPALDIGYVGNKEGTAILTHSLLPSAPIHIQVYPVKEIEFLLDPNLILTNDVENSVVRFVLVLQSEKSVGIKINNLIQDGRCRSDVRKIVRPHGYKCFMRFSNESVSFSAYELYNVTLSVVPETGQYACKLINLGVNGTEVSQLITNLTLWATTDDDEVKSEVLNIPFLPGIYALPEIILAENSNTGELVVVGLPEVLAQVSVQPADSSIIYVDKGKSTEETVRKYQVQLIDYHWRLADMDDAMGIILTSPITKQELRIIVKVSGMVGGQMCGISRSPIFNFLQNYKYAMIMATVMIIIFFLTFYFYSHYMQPIVNVNVNPGRSMIGPLTSPRPQHQCSTSMYSNRTPLNSTNISTQCQENCGNRTNCGCRANQSREPIYGDTSTFYTSTPDVRRNRRCM